jgi:hypothetical protein
MTRIKSTVRPRTDNDSPDGEKGYSSTLLLTSSLDGMSVQRHFRPALPPENKLVVHCTGGWVSLRVDLDGCGKYILHRDSNSQTVQPEENRYTDCTIPKYSGICTIWQKEMKIFQPGDRFLTDRDTDIDMGNKLDRGQEWNFCL